MVPFIQPRQSATVYKEKEVKKNENNNMFDNLLLLTALITTPPKITMSHSMRVLSVTSYAPRYRHSECSWGCMKEARSKARTRRELLQREACKSPSTNLLPGLCASGSGKGSPRCSSHTRRFRDSTERHTLPGCHG
jgi:hypothetical protein